MTRFGQLRRFGSVIGMLAGRTALIRCHTTSTGSSVIQSRARPLVDASYPSRVTDRYAGYMRAVRLTGFGGTEVLRIEEDQMPRPGPREVLIRVAAAGVNRADLHQRQGHYPPPAGASDILGLEVAGEFVARGTGTAERWKIDDKVCALVPGGGYAEYCVAHEGCCLPIPEKMELTAAASLPEAAFTVWANLFEPRRIHPNDRFLMQGGPAASGPLQSKRPRPLAQLSQRRLVRLKSAVSCWNWDANAPLITAKKTGRRVRWRGPAERA